jgi:thioredoxin 1
MKHITTDTFTEVISSNTMPTVVDFWATWCPPCMRLNDMLPMLSDKLNQVAEIAKVDIDANQDLANRYNIKSIPTFIIFMPNGEAIDAFNPSGTTTAIADRIIFAIDNYNNNMRYSVK